MHDNTFKKHGRKKLAVTEKVVRRMNARLYVPQIRLTGKYLAAIGFIPGKKIVIEYEPNKIHILLDEPTEKKEQAT